VIVITAGFAGKAHHISGLEGDINIPRGSPF
jgi:hypothetical protein